METSSRYEAFVGQRFGRLIVKRIVGRDERSNMLLACLCNCGNSVTVRADRLKANKVKSCGCFRNERLAAIRAAIQATPV
jgi:hypothetical protein